jgi:hypothetical protein
MALRSPSASRRRSSAGTISPAKKKRHTRKQIVTGNRSGLIIDQRPAVGGRAPDFAAFKSDHARRGVLKELAGLRGTIYTDSGFQGIQEKGLAAELRVVERARRNHPLTQQQREIRHRSDLAVGNREMS